MSVTVRVFVPTGRPVTDAEMHKTMQDRWMDDYWRTTRSHGGGLLTEKENQR